LVDEEHQAYLIDFGLARLEHQEIAISSIVAGTPGFMDPEELFNRPLNKSSDLYSLGATIICLVTNTRSTDISKLLDENYRFKFKHLVTGVNPEFIIWLQHMVAANPLDRIPDAKTSLARLRSLVEDLPSAIDIENTTSHAIVPVNSSRSPTHDRSKIFATVGAILVTICSLSLKFHRLQPEVVTTTTTTNIATTPASGSSAQQWYSNIKPRCNAVEVMTAIQASNPPSDWEGRGYAAACYALAGKIDAADRAICQLDPQTRAQAVNIVFTIGHPVADAGDDRSAGPMMELVLKYWPQNYLAMYHAGMSAYALNDLPLSKQRLTDFLNTYKAQDGWTNNARVVLGKIDKGTADRSYPKDP
jgi:serine/threonine protein kinase